MTQEVRLTPDRQELMAELARLSFEASQVAGPLDDAGFNWQPNDGKEWSVGQCIEHLVRANRLYLDALEEAARAAIEKEGVGEPTPLVPGRLGRWFIDSIEPESGPKLNAPKKIVPPSYCMKMSTLVAFAGEQQRIIELVRDTAGIDCNSIKFKNPLAYGLRVFNLSTGLLVMTAHERRHLLQARRVVERMPPA